LWWYVLLFVVNLSVVVFVCSYSRSNLLFIVDFYTKACAFAVKKNHLEFYAFRETLGRCRKQGIVVSLSKYSFVACIRSSFIMCIRSDFVQSSLLLFVIRRELSVSSTASAKRSTKSLTLVKLRRRTHVTCSLKPTRTHFRHKLSLRSASG